MKIENNHLHEMLNTLQEVPARDAEAMTQGRAQFLAEAEALRPLPPQPIPTPLQKIKSIFSTPSIQRVAVGFALFLAFLIVGGTGVTFAAEDSLPGDPLYGVKLTVEQARLRNPLLNAQEKEALLVNFTEERIVELDSLVQQERYDDLETAVSTFHRYVSQGRDLIPAQENDPFDTLVDQATQILAPVPENIELPPLVTEPTPSPTPPEPTPLSLTPVPPTPEPPLIEPPDEESDDDPCELDPESCNPDGEFEDEEECTDGDDECWPEDLEDLPCDPEFTLCDDGDDEWCLEDDPDCVDVEEPEACDPDFEFCDDLEEEPWPPEFPDCDPFDAYCDEDEEEFDDEFDDEFDEDWDDEFEDGSDDEFDDEFDEDWGDEWDDEEFEDEFEEEWDDEDEDV